MIQTKGPRVIVLVVSGLILAGPVNSRCPVNWVEHNRMCYGFSNGMLSWPQALGVCHAYGGTLVEPRNIEFNKFLKDEVKVRRMNSAWIGASDQFKEGRFEWPSDEHEINIRPFSRWNPSNSGGREHCLQIWSIYNDGWNDKKCETEVHYVCQRKVQVLGKR